VSKPSLQSETVPSAQNSLELIKRAPNGFLYNLLSGGQPCRVLGKYIRSATTCSNLLPVPFLVTAIPYLYHKLHTEDAVLTANAPLENPECLKGMVPSSLDLRMD